jgi:23S rRNA (uridine2479-2'-O)-methyltransferase
MKPNIKEIRIYSENNEFQHAEVLKKNRVKRSKNKKFFLEGVKSINLAIENNWEIDTFLYSDYDKLTDWAKNLLDKKIAKKHVEMPNSLLEKLSDKENSSEIIALVDMKENSLDRIKIKKDLFIVLLDRASSPGNLGTIIRSCNSFGVDAIIMTGHSVDLYDPKTIRASVGTLFSIPIIKVESHKELIYYIEKVKNELGNFNVIGTSVKTKEEINTTKLNTPLMLLVGNETYGLSSAYKELCDKLVKIPIYGSASSLNVACATSIFLYEINNNLKKNKEK